MARGSLLPCTTYPANCPCGKGLIIVSSPATILGKAFVVAFFGKRLIRALLDGCVLLGVLTIIIFSNIQAIFGELNVLAFGNVHSFSSVLSTPNHHVFALLVVTWHDMVVIASCEQQNEHLIVVGVVMFFPCISLLLLLLLAIQHNKMIAASSMLSSWCCNQSYHWRFAPLCSSMWLTHINEKDWLSLVQSRLLIAVNRGRCSLQYNRKKYCRHCSFLQYNVGHKNLIIALTMLLFCNQCLLLQSN